MIWYLLVVFIYFWVTKHQGGWEIFYSPVNVQGNSGGQRRRFRVWNQHFLNFMPSLWSEVQLTYVLIMTVFLGIFRAIDIGLHSRDLHTAQSAHSALVLTTLHTACTVNTTLHTAHLSHHKWPHVQCAVLTSHTADHHTHFTLHVQWTLHTTQCTSLHYTTQHTAHLSQHHWPPVQCAVLTSSITDH